MSSGKVARVWVKTRLGWRSFEGDEIERLDALKGSVIIRRKGFSLRFVGCPLEIHYQ